MPIKFDNNRRFFSKKKGIGAFRRAIPFDIGVLMFGTFIRGIRAVHRRQQPSR